MLEVLGDLASALSVLSTIGIVVVTIRSFANARLLAEQTEVLRRLEQKAEQQDRWLSIALQIDIPTADEIQPRLR